MSTRATLTAGLWNRRLRSAPGALARRAGRLRAAERLAALGVGVIAVSLLLPCYGVPGSDDLAATGLGEFTGLEAALVLTAGAALWLTLATGGGYDPPRPLSVGGMLIAAGAWSTVICGARLAYRPKFDLGQGIPSSDRYTIRYGLVVALAGAVMLLLAGIRARRRDLAGRARHSDVTDAP